MKRDLRIFSIFLAVLVQITATALLAGCAKEEPPAPNELQKPTGMKPDPSQKPPGGSVGGGAGMPQGIKQMRGKGGK